jgi:valyl-tRNA synthetase
MAGMFDVEKELARLNKQRVKLQKDYDGVTSRLSNTKFLEKASQVSGQQHSSTSSAESAVVLSRNFRLLVPQTTRIGSWNSIGSIKT